MEVKTEENVAPQANGLEAVVGKSGKKKAKRKNRSKNIATNACQEEHHTPQEEEEGDNGITSGKQNGITQDEQESSVENVCQKLEQSLKLGKNGLTNGTLSEAEHHHQVAKLEPTATTGKKKHKRHKNKSQSSTAVSGSEPVNCEPPSKSENSKPEDPPKKEDTTVVLPANESPPAIAPEEPPKPTITYQVYESELQMPCIMSLIQKDLSEPYSIYTYRYFIHNWPRLCFLAWHEERCVGAIVCKLDIHRQNVRRGYIAMLAVDKDYRKLKIGTTLVQKAIQAMLEDNADEVVLETEITNRPALRLYENLGFVRDKRLFHYYLNGVDALRLKLWFR